MYFSLLHWDRRKKCCPRAEYICDKGSNFLRTSVATILDLVNFFGESSLLPLICREWELRVIRWSDILKNDSTSVTSNKRSNLDILTKFRKCLCNFNMCISVVENLNLHCYCVDPTGHSTIMTSRYRLFITHCDSSLRFPARKNFLRSTTTISCCQSY